MSLFGDLGSSVNVVRPGRTSMPGVDMPLLITIAALVLFGLLMVYSASIALADGPRYANYGRYYFVLRHGIFIRSEERRVGKEGRCGVGASSGREARHER